MVRPQDILISNKNNQHAVEAEVKTIDFMGAFYRLEVVLPHEKVLIVYTPFVDVGVHEKIHIQLDKQKLLVF
jgi:ABC-type Fe3+/spermidine/putrescine transport system ATPase subunit